MNTADREKILREVLADMGTVRESRMTREDFRTQTMFWITSARKRGKARKARLQQMTWAELRRARVKLERKQRLIKISDMDINWLKNVMFRIKVNQHQFVRPNDPVARAIEDEYKFKAREFIEGDDFFYRHEEPDRDGNQRNSVAER